eukprot:gene265-3640_t
MSAILPEETSFPRGGDDVLTPLERKQLRLKAQNDAVEEARQSSGNKISRSSHDGSYVKTVKKSHQRLKPHQHKKLNQQSEKKSPLEKNSLFQKEKALKKDKKVNKEKLQQKSASSARAIIFKNLDTDSSLLGMIIDVQDFKATVSLPQGLVGVIYLSDVSPHYTNYLKSKATAKDESDIDEEDSDNSDGEYEFKSDSEDVPAEAKAQNSKDNDGKKKKRSKKKKKNNVDIMTFRKIFYIGQQIVCQVRSAVEKNGKHYITLTTDPEQINASLPLAALQKNRVIAACVQSIEDHGYVIDLGRPGHAGFLSKKLSKDICKKHDIPSLVPGQPILVYLTTKANTSRAVKVGAILSSLQTLKSETSNMTWNAIRPGMLVDVTVMSISNSGLHVDIHGVEGNIHYLHIPDGSFDATAIRKKYPKGTVVTARVVYSNPPKKEMNLSLLPLHVGFEYPSVSKDYIGKVIDNSCITSFEPRLGTLVNLPTYGRGLLYLNRVTDEKVKNIRELLKVGSEHRVRILSAHLMDNVYILSAQHNIVNARYLRYEDVQCGDIVEATVVSLEEYGALVSLTSSIRGLIPTLHYADVRLRRPEKKFFPGAVIKCRVLENTSSKDGKRKLALTCKKTLVESDLSVICSYADAKEGAIAHGVIHKVNENGCVVQFYNSVKGFVPLKQLSSTEAISDPAQYFAVGQVVKCRVTSHRIGKHRLYLSMRLSETSKNDLRKQQETVTNLKPGEIVPVVVDSIQPEGLCVHLQSNQLVLSTIPCMHLTDHPAFAEYKPACYTEGQVLDAVVLWNKHRTVHLSLKPALKAQAKEKIVSNIADLEVNEEHFGYVTKASKTMCFVNLIGSVSGMCPIKQVSTAYVRSVEGIFVPNQTVRVAVHKKTENKLDFSMAAVSLAPRWEQMYIKTFFEDLKVITKATKASTLNCSPGDIVEVTIQDVKDYGITVVTSDDVPGFISAAQAKGVALELDSTVQSVILDVDVDRGILDLGIRPELIESTNVLAQIKSKKKKNRDKKLEIWPDSILEATIELVKEDFMVLSLNDGRLAFAACKSYNKRDSPFRKYFPGNKCSVHVVEHTDRILCQIVDKVTQQTISPIEEARLGSQISAKVSSVLPNQINIKLSGGGRGRIHITEIPKASSSSTQNPCSTFKVGQVVNCRVIGFRDAKKHNFLPITHSGNKSTTLECSLLESELAASSSQVASRLSFEDLHVGDQVEGVIQNIEKDFLWINISIHARGRLRRLDASNPNVDFSKEYHIGMRISVWIKHIDGQKLDLTLIDPAANVPSDVVMGIVSSINPTHIIVKMKGRKGFGRVHLCDVSDQYTMNPFEAYKRGTVVKAKIISSPSNSTDGDQRKDFILSLRPSLLYPDTPEENYDGSVMSTKEVSIGAVYNGYIVNVTDNGVFVALSRTVVGRVQITNLSDLFIKNFAKVFAAGHLVRCRVLDVTAEGKIELTLKRSVVFPDEGKPIKFKDLKVEEHVTGIVKRVEKFGLFIAIENSKLTGLAHISECSDEPIETLEDVYSVGDTVKAKILRLNEENKRISLGLKPSYFGLDDDDKEPSSKRAKKQSPVKSVSQMSTNNSTEILNTTQIADKHYRIGVMKRREQEDVEEAHDVTLLEQSSNAYVDASDIAQETVLSKDADALQVIDDQVFASNVEHEINTLLFGEHEKEAEHSDDEIDDELDEGPVTKRAKHAARKKKDVETRRIEEAKVDTGKEPQTAAEFDLLVLQTPNSSYAWIRYMAFYLKLTELEKARSIAKRALNTINFREEKERMNVWVALLNLENAYGDEPSLHRAFTESCRQMDAMKIHFHLVSIYERSKKLEAAETLYKTMCKKFNKEQRVWLRYAEFKFKHGKSREARQVLERSLQSIPKREHINTIVKFGILEFKLGDAERGRTVFENILSNYPKRVDIWSIYLDQEQRIGDLTTIRSLYERVISLNVSSKKMKFLFKRFLEFEKENGNEQRVEHVKEKAREYVALKAA